VLLAERVARAAVKIAAALLPRPESLTMAEAWTADLLHADELGVARGDIVLGAGAYVVTRGASIWGRRRWARVALIVVILVAAVSLFSPWLLLPVLLLSAVLWLIFSPTRSSSGVHPRNDSEL
jgi:hypothetical protein